MKSCTFSAATVDRNSKTSGKHELEAGELLRAEVLHVLGRHRGPNLEDLGMYELEAGELLRAFSAATVDRNSKTSGMCESEAGELLRVQVLRILGRHRGPKREDNRHV